MKQAGVGPVPRTVVAVYDPASCNLVAGETVVLRHCGHEAGPGRSGATWCEHRAGERYCGCTDHN
jgi:hypothetical protein